MSRRSALLRDVAERVDQRLPADLHAAVSVDAEGFRGHLRTANRPFFDPEGDMSVTPRELRETSDWVLEQASYNAFSWGGLAGTLGPVTVLPEAMVTAVGAMRLAQKLAVVHGFDPGTERGRLAVWRALEAGLDLELPAEGPMELRLRDLPGLIVRRRARNSASAEVTRLVLRQSAWMVARRFSRYIPLFSTGWAATSARSRTLQMGARMQSVLRKMAGIDEVPEAEEATEIPSCDQ